MKRSLSPLLLYFFLSLSFPAYSDGEQGRTEVIILHMNDMHARIDGFGKVKYLADSLRRTHPYVFIVAAGDNFTGNPFVDMAADKEAPMIDLMNQCGFSVSCFGNHEFDPGRDFLKKRMEQARFPFICGNMDAGTSTVKQPKSYTVLQAGQIKIPVFGLIEINEQGIPDTHPSGVKGMYFTDPLEKAAEFQYLKKEYGSLLALTHLGIQTDEKLASEYPQTDVIIGGHSHTILKKPETVQGVLIVQAGSYQRFVGKLTLVFSNHTIAEKNDTLIAMESLKKSDAEVQSAIDRYSRNPEFEVVAGIADKAIRGPGELGAMMSDALSWATKTDIAFQNKGGIRLQEIPQGEIRIKDIYRLDPFGNKVVILRMNTEELRSLILNAYRKEKGLDLIPAGLSYKIRAGGKHHTARVVLYTKHGKLLDENREFSVALSSYVAEAYKFDHRDKGNDLETTTAECLIRFLQHSNRVDYKNTRRTWVSKE